MSHQPIRIALVGLGKIARDQHVPAIAASQDFELAATVDPAGSAIAGVPAFGSLQTLLDSPVAIDAVALCTPPQARTALALEALRAGLDVGINFGTTAMLRIGPLWRNTRLERDTGPSVLPDEFFQRSHALRSQLFIDQTDRAWLPRAGLSESSQLVKQ